MQPRSSCESIQDREAMLPPSIPLVTKCVTWILENALETQNVFRQAAPLDDIEIIVEYFEDYFDDESIAIDLNSIDVEGDKIHAVSHF